MIIQVVEVVKCCIFVIIFYFDVGKIIIIEKFLLMGKVIVVVGIVKLCKFDCYVMFDWMEMEKQCGIFIIILVMQFFYCEYMINLFDIFGYEDFFEDIYCILIVVDLVLMVFDGGKGVELWIIVLMEVCWLCDMFIVSFINKFDCDICDFIELFDEIEVVLKIKVVLIIWLIGCYKDFKGVYYLVDDRIIVYVLGYGYECIEIKVIEKFDFDEVCVYFGDFYDNFVEELELV